VSKETNNRVLRSTTVVSLFTGGSRLLGLVREMLMANFFGTSLATSAFVVAFRIPNLFRRLFGEGALSAAFIPVFTEALEKEGHDAANELAGKVMSMLTAALTMLVIGGIALVTLLLAYGDFEPKWRLTLLLLRIMLPYMLFICLVAFCMAVLNSFLHFALPAATPIILNVVWILALVFVCPRMGNTPCEQVYGIALGILAAGALQLLVQFPLLLKHKVSPRMSFAWRDDHVRRILLLMGPAAIGMGIIQLNVCIDGVLAMWAAIWAPAAMTFAERLIYLPLGVFATAMGTVLLPTFSRQAARDRHSQILTTLSSAAHNLMLVMIPASVGLIALGVPIVRLVFERGEFDAESTIQTARALWFYAPGLVIFSLEKLLVPAFYAMQDTRTPLRVGLWTVALNFVLNLTFVLTWPTPYKHAGLALATVMAHGVNCACLAVILTRRIGSPGWARIGASALRVLLAAIVMGVVAWQAHRLLATALAGTSFPAPAARLIAVGASMAAAVAVYATMAFLLLRSKLTSLIRNLRRR